MSGITFTQVLTASSTKVSSETTRTSSTEVSASDRRLWQLCSSRASTVSKHMWHMDVLGYSSIPSSNVICFYWNYFLVVYRGNSVARFSIYTQFHFTMMVREPVHFFFPRHSYTFRVLSRSVSRSNEQRLAHYQRQRSNSYLSVNVGLKGIRYLSYMVTEVVQAQHRLVSRSHVVHDRRRFSTRHACRLRHINSLINHLINFFNCHEHSTNQRGQFIRGVISISVFKSQRRHHFAFLVTCSRSQGFFHRQGPDLRGTSTIHYRFRNFHFIHFQFRSGLSLAVVPRANHFWGAQVTSFDSNHVRLFHVFRCHRLHGQCANKLGRFLLLSTVLHSHRGSTTLQGTKRYFRFLRHCYVSILGFRYRSVKFFNRFTRHRHVDMYHLSIPVHGLNYQTVFSQVRGSSNRSRPLYKLYRRASWLSPTSSTSRIIQFRCFVRSLRCFPVLFILGLPISFPVSQPGPSFQSGRSMPPTTQH